MMEFAAALQERLGCRFTNAPLLKQALTHRSFGLPHNERLEFLGDSVLNCAVAALLHEQYPALNEGDLSRVRSNLVKQAALVEIANRIELSEFVLLGEGELKSGGYKRPSILADTVEALFGALFLDQGFEVAAAVIRKLYAPVLATVDPQTLGKDAKTLLQEMLQSIKLPLPTYSVIATHGAAHNQMFEVECQVPKLKVLAVGNGASRRAAEQAAAKLALEGVIQSMPSAPKKRRLKSNSHAQTEVSAPDTPTLNGRSVIV
jgi:ribonuclease III